MEGKEEDSRLNKKKPSSTIKRNYRKEMDDILESLTDGSGKQEATASTGDLSPGSEKQTGHDCLKPVGAATDHKKPSLLLHACCGPCSSYCLETLVPYFDITIYYYNPNINPKEEYDRRITELKKFLTRFPDAIAGDVKLVEAEYIPEEFYEATKVRNETELAREPERGERCRRCYQLRMSKAYEYACRMGFDWFTTTLSISPHKDAEKINTIGFELEAAAKGGTRFLPSDFKKKNGFLRSTQLTEEYGMWRQNYCGCPYSVRKES